MKLNHTKRRRSFRRSKTRSSGKYHKCTHNYSTCIRHHHMKGG